MRRRVNSEDPFLNRDGAVGSQNLEHRANQACRCLFPLQCLKFDIFFKTMKILQLARSFQEKLLVYLSFQPEIPGNSSIYVSNKCDIPNVFSTCLCAVDSVDKNNNRLQNTSNFCKRLLFSSTPSTTHKQVEKTLTCVSASRFMVPFIISELFVDGDSVSQYHAEPSMLMG